MLERLEEIAGRTFDDHPFLQRTDIERLSSRLSDFPVEAQQRGGGDGSSEEAPDAAIPDAGTPEDRVRLNAELARAWLRAGNPDDAQRYFGAALAALTELDADRQAWWRRRLLLWTAVTLLREGELANCVAHPASDSCIVPLRGGGIHNDKGPGRAAVATLRQLVSSDIPEPWLAAGARWLLNIAAMTVGEYPESVPPALRIDLDGAAMPRFTNVAAEAGVASFDLAGGVVADDFDGDGDLDLITSTGDPRAALRYFANRGDGTFVERSLQAGFDGLYGGLNLVHGDYDGDGDLDLYVLRGGWLGEAGKHPNSLLQNDGQGRFTDVTFDAALGGVHYPTQTAAWADYDGDGDLDLYVGNEGFYEHPHRDGYPAQLFRNDAGVFRDVAEQAGVTNRRFAKGVAWGDYDADGDTDLYVSNYYGPNRLYRNEGNGTFRDVAEMLGVSTPEASFAAWWFDYDNDGTLDLFVNSYPTSLLDDWEHEELGAVVAGLEGTAHDSVAPRLYRGNGSGGFEDVTAATGLDRVTMTVGANFGDIDGDGFPDIYMGTGYPGLEGLVPNVLWRNVGGRHFEDVSTAGGFAHLQKGHGIAFADFDDDGDLDVFAQMGGFYAVDRFANALFENPGNDNGWVEVELVGAGSNRFGLGARLRADIVEEGRERSVFHTVGSGGSFGGNPLRAHIGIGSATRVERLEVSWPSGPTRQTIEAVAAGSRIRVREGEPRVEVLRRPNGTVSR